MIGDFILYVAGVAIGLIVGSWLERRVWRRKLSDGELAEVTKCDTTSGMQTHFCMELTLRAPVPPWWVPPPTGTADNVTLWEPRDESFSDGHSCHITRLEGRGVQVVLFLRKSGGGVQ